MGILTNLFELRGSVFVRVELLFQFDVVGFDNALFLLFFVLSVDLFKPLLVSRIVPTQTVRQATFRQVLRWKGFRLSLT